MLCWAVVLVTVLWRQITLQIEGPRAKKRSLYPLGVVAMEHVMW